MTVAEMMQRMDAGEFQRWKILELLDPWGERREDWRFALLASQVAAIAGVKKQDGRAFKAIDCILEFNTDLPDDDIDPIDEEAQKQQRAAAIESQVLKMFGVGVKQQMTPTKKIIQEHDKEK